LQNASALVEQGKVRPRLALGVARRMGAYGDISAEAMNTALSTLGYEPLNDDELQFLKLTSNVNLSKLVEVAGTTFTERFGSMINSLGADITNPKRFAQNINQMTSEIDRSKGNIISVGQANKSGKIRQQQGLDKPEFQVSRPKEENRGLRPEKMNPSQLRSERAKAQKAIDMVNAGSFKDKEKRINGIKATFKENTNGIDF